MDLLGLALVAPFAIGLLLSYLGVDFTDKKFFDREDS